MVSSAVHASSHAPDSMLSHVICSKYWRFQAMKTVEVPIYDFTKHQRSTETRRVEPADVVILEGEGSRQMPILVAVPVCWARWSLTAFESNFQGFWCCT